MENILDLIETRDFFDYQKDNFDAFLKKVSFSYNVPSIHIAGTNGKGSTARYIASIYQEAGYKVGLYSSPSLYEVNETIKINKESISDEIIKNYIEKNRKLFKKYDLSSFEILTYIAFNYFMDNKCDIAVIECGMGGEFDATNIFEPILSIITSVSLEHTNYLGRTVSEIAENKAGIIKDEIPVLFGDLSEEAISSIVKVSKERSAPIKRSATSSNVVHTPIDLTFDYKNLKGIHLNSIASFSITDACYAIDAVEILMDKFPVSEEAIRKGLEKTVNLCCMEIIQDQPFFVIDGAHNPEAFEYLKKAFIASKHYRPIRTVFACFKDKNLPKMLAYAGEMSDTLYLTTFNHPRARTKGDYFLFGDEYPFFDDPKEAVDKLLTEYPDDTILVTGSLAFAAYIRRIYKK